MGRNKLTKYVAGLLEEWDMKDPPDACSGWPYEMIAEDLLIKIENFKDSKRMKIEQAEEFLTSAARYFRNRPTGGEDMAYWANVYNAENCEKIIKLLLEETKEKNDAQGD